MVTENKKYDHLDIYDLNTDRSLTTQYGHTSCVQRYDGRYLFHPTSWCSYLNQFKDRFYAKKAEYLAQQRAPKQDPAVVKYLDEYKQYQNYLAKRFSKKIACFDQVAVMQNSYLGKKTQEKLEIEFKKLFPTT